MDKIFFKGKKVTVFGLGLHGGGVGVVKFLASCGANVVVTDLKNKEQLAVSLDKLKGVKNVKYVLGQHRLEDFTHTDMVIKNPAAPWSDKHIKLALEHNVPVEMDSSLFFRLCKNKIVGITGTKGKTTTATLAAEILKAAGKSVVRVGIGQTSVLDKLDALKKDSIVVFELSSWRLSALGRAMISPSVAVFKNLMPDHLNYYKTMDKYIEDKKYIFSNQKAKDWLVLNEDDEIVRGFAKEAESQLMRFSYAKLTQSNSVFIEEDAIYYNDGVDVKKIIDVSEVKIPGRHNLSNVMAAICVAITCEVSMLQIKKAVKNLTGVPHRLEFVCDIKGVRYYNDTAATIPHAAISALNSFEAPIVLIAGGNDKELVFEELGKEIAQKVKKIILLEGTATKKLLTEVKKHLTIEEYGKILVVDSMNGAVLEASRASEEGDVVLLSPGAASFGLFLNEFDRGEKFREAVQRL